MTLQPLASRCYGTRRVKDPTLCLGGLWSPLQLLPNFHPPGLPSPCGLSRRLLSMCGQGLEHHNDPACVGACGGGGGGAAVSKALLKSKITTSVWIPASLDLNMSCMVVSSWVSQVYSSLKLWFLSLSMLCLSRWSQRLTNDVFEQLTGYRRQ